MLAGKHRVKIYGNTDYVSLSVLDLNLCRKSLLRSWSTIKKADSDHLGFRKWSK